jgi:hypothetical protein
VPDLDPGLLPSPVKIDEKYSKAIQWEGSGILKANVKRKGSQMSMLRDLTGQKFGKLTVLRRVERPHTRKAYWLCSCDCGQEKVICGRELLSGDTKACGCLWRKHGMWGTRTYQAFKAAKKRCTTVTDKDYAKYGGRGITFLYTSFEQFLTEMGECPPEMTLGRINNDRNYEPGNCQWESPRQQANNRHNNRPVTAFGRTENLQAWANIFGLPKETLRRRLEKGLAPEQCLLQQGKMIRRTSIHAAALFLAATASDQKRIFVFRTKMDGFADGVLQAAIVPQEILSRIAA